MFIARQICGNRVINLSWIIVFVCDSFQKLQESLGDERGWQISFILFLQTARCCLFFQVYNVTSFFKDYFAVSFRCN